MASSLSAGSLSDVAGDLKPNISYSVIRKEGDTPPPPLPPGVAVPTAPTAPTTPAASKQSDATTSAHKNGNANNKNGTLKKNGVASILDVDVTVLGVKLMPYLRQYEWIDFSSVCKHCAYAFDKYLKYAANSTNIYAKHVPMRALRQYLLRNRSKYYPLTVLHILKQNGAQATSNAVEYLSKLRHAITQEDLFTVSILLDFGLSSERVIYELMDRYCEYQVSDAMFALLLSKIRDLNNFHQIYNDKGATSIHVNSKRLYYFPIHLECIFNGQLSYFKVLASKDYLHKLDWQYVTPKDERNLCFWAVCSRDDEYYLEYLNTLLNTKLCDMSAKDRYGRNGAFVAIRHNRIDALMFLIDQCGVDINCKDKFNNSLMHYACERGNDESLEYLLTKKADAKGQNDDGETPMDIAVMYSRHECVKILKQFEIANIGGIGGNAGSVGSVRTNANHLAVKPDPAEGKMMDVV